MAFKIYKFRDCYEMELHLNGGAMAGDLRNGVPGLEGLTLIFTAPAAGTVTFGAPANGHAHTGAEVIAQINAAAIAGLSASQKDGRLVLKAASGSLAVSGGTGLAKLGLSAGTLAKVYAAPGGAAPAYVESFADAQTFHLVVTE